MQIEVDTKNIAKISLSLKEDGKLKIGCFGNPRYSSKCLAEDLEKVDSKGNDHTFQDCLKYFYPETKLFESKKTVINILSKNENILKEFN